MATLSITGELTDRDYHEACLIADDICQLTPSLRLHCRALPWIQWTRLLHSCRRATQTTRVLLHHSLVGSFHDVDDMIRWAAHSLSYMDERPADDKRHVYQAALQKLVQRALLQHIQRGYLTGECYVMLEFTVQSLKGGADVYRMLFALDSRHCPRTVDNFLALCEGKDVQGTYLHYLKCPVHRLVPHAYLQTGDVQGGQGDKGTSIWGETFMDEYLQGIHDSAGCLSMCNSGPHSNQSQFMITLGPMASFDNRYVQFGQLLYDQSGLIDRLNEAVDVDIDLDRNSPLSLEDKADGRVLVKLQRPLTPIIVSACSELHSDIAARQLEAFFQTKHVSSAIQPTAKDTAGDSVQELSNATLLVIGPEASGKSSLVAVLCDNDIDIPTPTLGFELDRLNHCFGFNYTFYCLGGSPSIKGYWKAYLDAAHVLLYVVDSTISNEEYWCEVRLELNQLNQDPFVHGKPIFLVANRRPAKPFLDRVSISERLNWPISSIHECCTRKNDEPTHMLLKAVSQSLEPIYSTVAERVKLDVIESKRKAREELQRRREEQQRERGIKTEEGTNQS